MQGRLDAYVAWVRDLGLHHLEVSDGSIELDHAEKCRIIERYAGEVELDEGYAPGKDAEVRVSLEALPEVPTPEIDDLQLDRLTVDPDPSAVDEQIKQLALRHEQLSEEQLRSNAAGGIERRGL